MKPHTLRSQCLAEDNLVIARLVKIANPGFLSVAASPVERSPVLETRQARRFHQQDTFTTRTQSLFDVPQQCRSAPLPLTVGMNGNQVQILRSLGQPLRRAIRHACRTAVVVGQPAMVTVRAVKIVGHHAV